MVESGKNNPPESVTTLGGIFARNSGVYATTMYGTQRCTSLCVRQPRYFQGSIARCYGNGYAVDYPAAIFKLFTVANILQSYQLSKQQARQPHVVTPAPSRPVTRSMTGQKRKSRETTLTDEEEAEIYRLYKNGWTVRELKAKYHIGDKKARRIVGQNAPNEKGKEKEKDSLLSESAPGTPLLPTNLDEDTNSVSATNMLV